MNNEAKMTLRGQGSNKFLLKGLIFSAKGMERLP